MIAVAFFGGKLNTCREPPAPSSEKKACDASFAKREQVSCREVGHSKLVIAANCPGITNLGVIIIIDSFPLRSTGD